MFLGNESSKRQSSLEASGRMLRFGSFESCQGALRKVLRISTVPPVQTTSGLSFLGTLPRNGNEKPLETKRPCPFSNCVTAVVTENTSDHA